MTTTTRHVLHYDCVRDPEGNFWTVTCSCGRLQEGTGSRREARNEGRYHKQREAELAQRECNA